MVWWCSRRGGGGGGGGGGGTDGEGGGSFEVGCIWGEVAFEDGVRYWWRGQ